jgi:hypothetical protein
MRTSQGLLSKETSCERSPATSSTSAAYPAASRPVSAARPQASAARDVALDSFRDQVGMAVEQAGQHRAGILRHLDTVRQVDWFRLDADDPFALEDHGCRTGQETGTVERVSRANRMHAQTLSGQGCSGKARTFRRPGDSLPPCIAICPTRLRFTGAETA